MKLKSKMKVITVKCLDDNFSYIVLDEKNNNACVIDPGESKPIIDKVKKEKINLRYILNTHHHDDHVAGNLELKKKFNCKIIGFIKDKDNIPGIDITVKDRELYKSEDFEFITYHTPGHTNGHVIFHFHKLNYLFTGDTLFSLGCGRIFEGSYDQMFKSLSIIKNFPKDTMIYFGHEYTLKNSKFCIHHDTSNNRLKNKIFEISEKLKNKLSTTPTNLKDELDCNIFLKCEDLNSFSKLRELKDNF